MSRDFHESYSQAEIKPPSERSTGLVFAAVALIAAAWWRHAPIAPWVALWLAAALLTLSFAAPRVLGPLNLIWFRLGLLLHRIVNPLVMLVMFVAVFVPAGLIMRLWHDPLRSRRAVPGASYWIERTREGARAASMERQF